MGFQSVTSRAGRASAEEMTETAFSMGFMKVRGSAAKELTEKIESEFWSEVATDGFGAAFNVVQSQIMNWQQEIIQRTFSIFGAAAVAIVNAGKLKAGNLLKKYKKGRKSTLARGLGNYVNNLTTEDARLIADFGSMNVNGTNGVNASSSKMQQYEQMQNLKKVEIQREGLASQHANLGMTALDIAFKAKLDTASFTIYDRELIQKITQVPIVDSAFIDKLNAISKAKYFQDSEGNIIGQAQALTELVLGLRLQ